MKVRQDTKLESEGAEFLVLGLLLIEGISAYKAYINFPGYDLTAVNPETKRVARIQVKSRWATDYDNSFPLKNLDCDFVVHVALNRGFRFRKKNNLKEIAIKPPRFYVFPVEILKTIRNEKGWNKVQIRKVENLENYIDNWKLIISADEKKRLILSVTGVDLITSCNSSSVVSIQIIYPIYYRLLIILLHALRN